MIDTDNFNLKEKLDTVNNNFEDQFELEKLRKELRMKFANYQRTMKYLSADAPISVLCLPGIIEKILSDSGFLRIYDLFDLDLIKVKGLGVSRVRQLTTRLDEFFSML